MKFKNNANSKLTYNKKNYRKWKSRYSTPQVRSPKPNSEITTLTYENTSQAVFVLKGKGKAREIVQSFAATYLVAALVKK